MAYRSTWDQIAAHPVYDALMRLPIITVGLFFLTLDLRSLHHVVSTMAAQGGQWEPSFLISVFSRLASLMFLAMLTMLHVVRHRPVGRSSGLTPRLTAVLAVILPWLFLLLPRPDPSLAFNLASALLILLGNTMAMVTLSFLGRSLSVFPEARRLITGGPYGMVRHPLYLCEMVAVTGVLLQLRTVEALAIAIAVLILLLARTHWEERVLTQSFPDYEHYRQQVPARILPNNPLSVIPAFLGDAAAAWRFALSALALAAATLAATTLLPVV